MTLTLLGCLSKETQALPSLLERREFLGTSLGGIWSWYRDN
jgi:hypothetical protein